MYVGLRMQTVHTCSDGHENDKKVEVSTDPKPYTPNKTKSSSPLFKRGRPPLPAPGCGLP